MRIVLDVHVLVSAIFGGIPAQALKRALQEEVFLSQAVEKHSATREFARVEFLKWNTGER